AGGMSERGSELRQGLDVAVLGAGAAGMMGAVAAAEIAGAGRRIAIFEKNERPGIKVLVCGGGRCNFTNAGTTDFLIGQFGRNGRFLTPALRHLDNEGLRDFFAELGVPSHVEHDGKVYPDSNQARSVVDALVRRMKELGVEIFSGKDHAVATLERSENGFVITTAAHVRYEARKVLLAVGGMSYQRMGTVGDGYRLAGALGHTIVMPRPAIVGLIANEEWIKGLQGLAVRDVEVTMEVPAGWKGRPENRVSIHDILFTHFGLSGPAILNPSETIAELLEQSATVRLHVDFARHTTHEGAHAILRQWQQHHGKKRLRTMLAQAAPEILISATSPDQTGISAHAADNRAGEGPLSLPARLAAKVCELEDVSPEQPCAILTSAQIHRLVERIKRCAFTISGTRGFKEAMVTAGGIALKEVEPRTMESKLVPGLFLTGEVLDLTGPSGGYNLQLAFSTGHLAGRTIGKELANGTA
ncbi:MAG TPA: NAD(P)/FAD-dependent oxidoreductase, partial [Phycisphaerae bacterium]